MVARQDHPVLSIVSGAVAGLGTITPASGFVLPWHGMVIGILAGAACYYACTAIKIRFKYDDSLDVFGVHGVGGILGTLLVGVFATAAVSMTPDTPNDLPGLIDGNPRQCADPVLRCGGDNAWCGHRDFRHPQGHRPFDAVARVA